MGERHTRERIPALEREGFGRFNSILYISGVNAAIGERIENGEQENCDEQRQPVAQLGGAPRRTEKLGRAAGRRKQRGRGSAERRDPQYGGRSARNIQN